MGANTPESKLGRPVRYMQINLFYPGYIHDFYAARPGMGDQPFQTQIDALMNDGFYAPHLMLPELADLGYDVRSIVINSNPSQAAWMRERGHAVTADTVNAAKAAKMQVEEFDPDIIYFLDTGVMDSKFVRALAKPPALVGGWRGFPYPDYTDLTSFDIILSSFDLTMNQAKERGARQVTRFHPGFPTNNTVGDEPRRIDWDVVFSGIVTREHKQRAALLNMLCTISRDPAAGFRFGVFMPDSSFMPEAVRRLDRGPKWGQDMLRTLRNTHILLNMSVDSFGGAPPYMRLFEACGVGAFMITTHHPDLRDFFEPGREIETFRNENELFSKIMYYLANPARCAEIGAAALARCRRDHTAAVRAKWFKQILDEALMQKLEQTAA